GGEDSGATTEMALPAGGRGWVGIYISPTLTSLPPEGTPYPFSVTATAQENGALTETENETFTVPGIAYNYLTVDPALIMASPNSTETFEIELTNVGNIAGSFELTMTFPANWTQLSPPVTPVGLDAGDDVTLPVDFEIGDSDIGKFYTILVESPAPGTEYVQRAIVEVEIYSARTLALFEMLDHLQTDCSIGGDVILPAALSYLGTAINDLEASCQYGSCAPDLRDRVVSAVNAVANHSDPLSPLISADTSFHSIADAMSGHIEAVDIEADLVAIMDAVELLDTEVCAVAQHDLEASFIPATSVVLEGISTAVNLQVRNVGSLETTAVLTLTPPTGGSVSWTNQSVVLDPGETISIPTEIEPAGMGAWLARVDIGAGETPVVQYQAAANVVVVDAFIHIGEVIVSPSFVEFDSGSVVSVYADVSNVANLPLEGEAELGVLAADGTPVFDSTTPILLPSSLEPIRLDMGDIDTTGLVTGSYTVTVRIVDNEDTLIPDGTGEGMLAVGQAVEAVHWVEPVVVAPGTVSVTTSIETSLSDSILEQMASGARQVDPVRTIDIQANEEIDYSPAGYTPAASSTGDLIVRMEAPGRQPESALSIDAAQLVYINDFEGSVGAEWSSTITSTAPGGQSFLGRFNNNAISLTLSSLAAHQGIMALYELYIIQSWDGNGDNGPEIFDYSASDGPQFLYTTFAQGSGGTQSYPGEYPTDSYSGRTGALETSTLGYTWNGNPSDSVYFISRVFTHTAPTLTLNLAASGLQGIDDESWGLDNFKIYLLPAGGSAADLDVTGTVTQSVAGDSFPLTVTALDSVGDVAMGYTGTVILTSTDPQATLPVSYTFDTGEAADNGQHTFVGIVLRTAGEQTVTVTDMDDGGIEDIITITVNLGGTDLSATEFTASSPHKADGMEASTVAVTVTDSFGNPIPNADVWLTASGMGNTISGSPGTTGADGTMIATITSIVPGVKMVRALVDDRASTSWIAVVQLVEFTGAGVAGTVFNDGNQDNVMQAGEAGLGGVQMRLYADGEDDPLKTTVTASDGGYTFTGLAAGTYRIEQTQLDEFALSGSGVLTANLHAFDFTGVYDYGNHAAGTVSGVVWTDEDQDGQQEGGEEPIPGVTVNAYVSGGVLVDTIMTDQDGQYQLKLAADLPAAPDNFVFNSGRLLIQEPASAVIGNGDFSQQRIALDSSTYPANYDFSSGSLDDWTPSNSNVTVVDDSYSLDGPYLWINQYSQYADSPEFSVPPEAQSLRFNFYNYSSHTEASRPVYVYVLSGPAFGTSTNIGSASGTALQGWLTASIDIQAWQGQTIKLRFRADTESYYSTRSRIDNISLNNEVPDWTFTDALYTAIISNSNNLDGPYLRLNRYNHSAYSPAFIVPEDAQSLRFNYYNWTTRSSGESRPLYVYVLSGEDFSTSTSLGSYSGSNLEGWKTAVMDIQSFAGQQIKLRFQAENESYWNTRSRLDNLALYLESPGWQPSDARYVRIGEDDVPKDPGVQAPENADFEMGLTPEDTAIYPENYDFSNGVTYLPTSTYPANYDFSSGDLDGWSVSSSTYVGVLSDSYNLDGYYLRINYYNHSATSPAFTVPEDAQSVRFDYMNWHWRSDSQGTTRPLHVYILSGPDYGISTLIGSVYGTWSQDWNSAVLDIQTYQGQSVKLYFKTDNDSYWGVRSRVDNISLQTEAPGWNISDSAYVRVVENDYSKPGSGPYLMINRYDHYADSEPVELPEGIQSLRFDYVSYANRQTNHSQSFTVYVLSGPNFDTVTSIGTASGTRLDGWTSARFGLENFAGQTVKFRFQTNDSYWDGRARIDNVSLNYEAPGWTTNSTSNIWVRGDAPPEDPSTGFENGDFGLGLTPYDPAIYPENYDFSQTSVSLDTSTYPANYDFETGDLGGWSVSSSTYVEVISDSYNLDSYYMRINRYNQSATSPSFTVPEDAQSVRFNTFIWNWRDNTTDQTLYVYVLSGPSFEITTRIGEASSAYDDGWIQAVLDIQTFQGRTIKLRFATENDSYWGTKARVDNISLVTELPAGWRPSNTSYYYVHIISDSHNLNGPYLRLNRFNMYADSPLFTVPDDAQSLRFNYQNWSTKDYSKSSLLNVQVRSGPDLGMVTQIGTVSGSYNNGWLTAQINLQQFQGQEIKLRFITENDSYWNYRSRIDNISINLEAPEWSLSDASLLRVQSSGGISGSYLLLNRYGVSASTQPFLVPTSTDTLKFDYLNYNGRGNPDHTSYLHVYAYGGDGFSVPVLLATVSGTENQGWKSASINLASVRGRYIFLRFYTDSDTYWNYKSKIDNIRLVDGAGGNPQGVDDHPSNYVKLNQYGNSVTSTPFQVPFNADQLEFDYLNWSTRNGTHSEPMYVYVLSGPDFGVSHQLATFNGSFVNGWRQATVDFSGYRDQIVKLRFQSSGDSYWNGRSKIDNVEITVDPEATGDSPPEVYGDSTYLHLTQYGQSGYSTPVQVPTNTQTLHFDYLIYNTRNINSNRPLYVYALSGPDYGTSTNLGTLWSNNLLGWREANLDLTAFQGETVKFRFLTDNDSYWNGRSKVDNVYLQPFATTPYTLTEINPPNYTSSTSDTVPIDLFGGANFSVDFGDFGIDRYQSTIEVSPDQLTADGVSTAAVTVTIKDGGNNPLSGYEVELIAAGTYLTVLQPGQPTDANGQTVGGIRSIYAPQVALVTARTISDNVTLAATVPVTFTPGPPDEDQSGLTASPQSVVADGVDSALYTVTLRDQYGNLVEGKQVTVTIQAAMPVTQTQPSTLTNAAGQINGTVRSLHEQTITLQAYDVTDDITVTQTAEVKFSSVDPGLSSIDVSPHTLVADGVSTSTVTVTLRNLAVGPLAGKSVEIEVDCDGCSLGGGRSIGPVEIGPTGADGTATTILSSTDVEIVTISAIGDGIPLDDTAQITFTVGSVDSDASTLTGSPATVVADGVSYASLAATLVDSYGHPVPGKTVLIRSTGTGLIMNQTNTTTDANGQVKARLASTVVQLVTVSAYDQSDGITLTQMVGINFVVGPADQANSTLVISPTTVLADGVQTTVITATLRDVLDHPVANRPVQLVVTGQNNTITPSSVGVTGGDGTIVFNLASTSVETKDISIRDVPNDATLDIGQVEFIPGEVDPDISTLAANKTTVFIGSDEATLTATLWDNLGHRISGKQVQIIAYGTNVTVTQPVDITNSQGQVQATIKSDTVQEVMVKAIDLTDDITLTQVVALTFIAGPVDEAMSTITITPTTVVANGVQTTVISATLHDADDNPLVNRPIRLAVTGQSNTVTPSTQQYTDNDGHVEYTLASTKAETKQISLKDELADVTLQAGQVTFVAGAVNKTRSSLGANPSKTAADGTSPIVITIYALDEYGNPIEGVDVVLDAQIVSRRSPETVVVTVTQPVSPTSASGAAFGSLVGSGVGEVVVSATAGGVLLDDQALVEFEPLYNYRSSISPSTKSAPVGAEATFVIQVDNQGYLPDDYTISLAEPYPDWFSLAAGTLSLDAGEVGQTTLLAQTDDCLDAGSYRFYVRVASAGVGNVTTLTGTLTVTSDPVLTNLSPADGTDIGSTGALFSWQTAVSATTSLFVKPVTGTLYTEYSGTGGMTHKVTVEGLARNTDYHWYARSQSVCGAVESVSRTLGVLNGVVFTQRAYQFNVERDYNQLVSISIYNQDIISHTVVVTLENPYPELIIGFVGEGSIDDPFVLEAGETRTLQLVVHAQDVVQSDFDLIARLTADDEGESPIQDAAPIDLNVHIPYINFTIERTGINTATLVSTYRVTNYGDPLTDLAITKDVTGTGTVYLLPAMSHGYLGTGKSFTFSAYPAIDSGFTEISGTIRASSAGVITTTSILLSIPEGSGMYLGRATDTSMETSTADWYCTNRPVIQNTLVLPPGFRRVDVTNADFFFSIDSEKSWSNVRPHDVYIRLNNNQIGELRDMIPHGLYTFPVDPDYLNEALIGPSVNTIQLETLHLNGGHYVVASDMMLFLCLNQYSEWVAASSQEEANQIVSNRAFLIPAATTLDVEILTPASGQEVVAGFDSMVKVRVTSDLEQALFYQVTATADNGNGSILLYDDGEHDDGEYKDGVYANEWRPANAGPTTLTVHAGSCTVAGEAEVGVTVTSLNYA
ncbi:MAG: Ig-like domain-containing protein, partial [Anaerolineales bacterium]|nr:Ig-like domain-containing protein [Anaerolineales bacterium]